MALHVLEKAVHNPDKYVPFEVLLTVREEQGCVGAKVLNSAHLQAHWGICLDGETEVGTAIVHAPTKLKYTLQVQGKSSHAALNPEDGVNAILYACQIGASLPTGFLDSETTSNIGIIQGGTSINVVPDLCVLKGELRSLEKANLSYWKEEITKRVQEFPCIPNASLHTSYPLPRSILSWEEAYPGYHLSIELPSLRRFQQASRLQGINPRLLSSRGGGVRQLLECQRDSLLCVWDRHGGDSHLHRTVPFI